MDSRSHGQGASAPNKDDSHEAQRFAKMMEEARAKMHAETEESIRTCRAISDAGEPGQSVWENPVILAIIRGLSYMAAQAAAHQEATNGGVFGEKPSRVEIVALRYCAEDGELPGVVRGLLGDLGCAEWATTMPSIFDYLTWPADGPMDGMRAGIARLFASS